MRAKANTVVAKAKVVEGSVEAMAISAPCIAPCALVREATARAPSARSLNVRSEERSTWHHKGREGREPFFGR